MKKLFILGMAIVIAISLNAQVEPKVDYKARAERNLKLLVKDSTLLNQVSIKNDGIYLYDKSSAKPEFILYWKEVGHFLRLCYNLNYYEMNDLYSRKRTTSFYLNDVMDFIEYSLAAPSILGGLRVAIDPGHFASNWDEALQERRYVKVKPEEIGLPSSAGDQKVMEAELTSFTAEILADTLRKLGAVPFITREPGQSVIGKQFEQWYKEDFEKDLQKYSASGDITPELAKLLRTETKGFVFENFYKYIDFVQRSRKINDFHADLTIVIHFNADENNERVENRYTHLTNENYSMVFIPGAFVWGELYKMNSRIEFLRLLVSPDLEESERLSKVMIKNFNNIGVPPIPHDNDLMHPKKYCLASQYDGLYHRNIYLTRSIEGPVSYIECLYQDNKKEFPKLVKRDFTLHGKKYPKRCAEIAYAVLLETIKEWVAENGKLEDLVR